MALIVIRVLSQAMVLGEGRERLRAVFGAKIQ